MDTIFGEFAADYRIETKELEQRQLGIDTRKPSSEKRCLYYGNGCTMKQKCRSGWQLKDGGCELYACNK